jgi:hypothetical protein
LFMMDDTCLNPDVPQWHVRDGSVSRKIDKHSRGENKPIRPTIIWDELRRNERCRLCPSTRPYQQIVRYATHTL